MKPLKIVIYAQWVLPIINPRSHRTWQLALNLAKQGHDVTIYALLGKTDYSKYEKEYGLKIKNLGYSWYGCINSDGGKQPLHCRAIMKLLGNKFLYPDIELKRLVKKSLSSLTENIDLLITIASPHTIHWGAAEVMNKPNIKCWIADCGDPFMLNPFHTPSPKYEKLERNWCEKANAITIPIKEGKNGYYKDYHHKIHIIPQGFDFSETKLANYSINKIPTFAFSGVVYPGMRDPSNFLKFLLNLKIDFKFIVYSKYRKQFEPYATDLRDKFVFYNYIPRNLLIYELSKMDFLININNIGNVQQPSKLIDYALSKRPILSISSEFGETEQANFVQFLNHNYNNRTEVRNIEQFDIQNVCQNFIDLYNKCIMHE